MRHGTTGFDRNEFESETSFSFFFYDYVDNLGYEEREEKLFSICLASAWVQDQDRAKKKGKQKA